MSAVLFQKEYRSNYKLLILFAAVLTMYTAMIISMFDPELGKSLAMMMENMEGIFSAFGMADPGTTLLEFQINYLFGFLYVAFPMIWIILLVNRLMIRYVEKGTMSCLLASPNSRMKIARTQAAVLYSNILILAIYLTALGISLSQAMFPGELEVQSYILAMAGLLGLLFSLGGICFLSACACREPRYALGIGSGICVLSVLIQMVSQVGDKFGFLKYMTLLTLFDPNGLTSGKTEAFLGTAVLYVIGAGCAGLAFRSFRGRDFSV